jgi:sigma-B regulation protein RsbQ
VDVRGRHHVVVSGPEDGPLLLLAHGFGCDQNMWRLVEPILSRRCRVVTFDFIGAGGADPAAWSAQRYSSLEGYAQDVADICRGMDLRDVVFVGHSVSAMTGVLAAQLVPDRITKLVLMTPSPRYVDDGDYHGGFSRADIDELLESLESNYLGWSAAMAPVIMGNPDRPELGTELTNSFCRTDPKIAKQFAEVTFRSDNRADLARVSTPSLVLQCSDDAIAPTAVGEYVHRNVAGSEYVLLAATGHCPNLSAPEETVAAIRAFV